MKIQTNVNAIYNAFNRINKTAESIASRNLDRLPEDMVNLIVDQRDVEANTKVIKTYDQLLGTIIDTFA